MKFSQSLNRYFKINRKGKHTHTHTHRERGERVKVKKERKKIIMMVLMTLMRSKDNRTTTVIIIKITIMMRLLLVNCIQSFKFLLKHVFYSFFSLCLPMCVCSCIYFNNIEWSFSLLVGVPLFVFFFCLINTPHSYFCFEKKKFSKKITAGKILQIVVVFLLFFMMKKRKLIGKTNNK